jgi:LPPG:FO 2-phospho-L-lactate transferase
MTEALRAAAAPVIAVSPIVDGDVVKGPTAAFLEWAGQTMDAAGIAATYEGLIDGLVTDERADLDVPSLVTPTLMTDAPSRERVARDTLAFALALASRG